MTTTEKAAAMRRAAQTLVEEQMSAAPTNIELIRAARAFRDEVFDLHVAHAARLFNLIREA